METLRKFLRYDDLKTLGIPYSRVSVDRMQAVGRFPRKIKLSENTAVYDRAEVEAWIKARIAARDNAKAA